MGTKANVEYYCNLSFSATFENLACQETFGASTISDHGILDHGNFIGFIGHFFSKDLM